MLDIICGRIATETATNLSEDVRSDVTRFLIGEQCVNHSDDLKIAECDRGVTNVTELRTWQNSQIKKIVRRAVSVEVVAIHDSSIHWIAVRAEAVVVVSRAGRTVTTCPGRVERWT